jgi:hypothetical protein
MHSICSLAITSLALLAGSTAWADDDIWKRPALLDSPRRGEAGAGRQGR